jgi:hypothetical protein
VLVRYLGPAIESAPSGAVSAASLYEAIAPDLSALRGHDWVGDIGKGLTTVSVRVRHWICVQAGYARDMDVHQRNRCEPFAREGGVDTPPSRR